MKYSSLVCSSPQGGHLVDSWSLKCSHLVMSGLTVTIKVRFLTLLFIQLKKNFFGREAVRGEEERKGNLFPLPLSHLNKTLFICLVMSWTILDDLLLSKVLVHAHLILARTEV